MDEVESCLPSNPELFVKENVSELRRILGSPVFRAAVQVVRERGRPGPTTITEPLDVAARRASFVCGMEEFVRGLHFLTRIVVPFSTPEPGPWDYIGKHARDEGARDPGAELEP